jgi:hypothetical protein
MANSLQGGQGGEAIGQVQPGHAFKIAHCGEVEHPVPALQQGGVVEQLLALVRGKVELEGSQGLVQKAFEGKAANCAGRTHTHARASFSSLSAFLRTPLRK